MFIFIWSNLFVRLFSCSSLVCSKLQNVLLLNILIWFSVFDCAVPFRYGQKCLWNLSEPSLTSRHMWLLCERNCNRANSIWTFDVDIVKIPFGNMQSINKKIIEMLLQAHMHTKSPHNSVFIWYCAMLLRLNFVYSSYCILTVVARPNAKKTRFGECIRAHSLPQSITQSNNDARK